MSTGSPSVARQRLWRWAVLMAALACLGFGIWRGEGEVVLDKAVRVCLECIGLG